MDQIRVWRVTIDGHSAVFDDVNVASRFVGGFLGKRTAGVDEPKIVMESEWMGAEEYRKLCDKEDEA